MIRNSILSAAIIVAIFAIVVSVLWMEGEGTIIFIAVLIIASWSVIDASREKGDKDEH